MPENWNVPVATALCVVLFTIIDKVVAPLIRNKMGMGNGFPKAEQYKWEAQLLRDRRHSERISHLEKTVRGIRESVHGLEKDLAVARTTLDNIRDILKSGS